MEDEAFAAEGYRKRWRLHLELATELVEDEAFAAEGYRKRWRLHLELATELAQTSQESNRLLGDVPAWNPT